MAKRANPTLIGGFVLGGIVLAVAVVLLLGGRAWFKRPVTCVMAFDDSVAGLTVGSPVSFRGVQLGTVSSIELRAQEIRAHTRSEERRVGKECRSRWSPEC